MLARKSALFRGDADTNAAVDLIVFALLALKRCFSRQQWDRGGELGEMMINTPIRQCVSGIGGVYEYTMLELPAMPVHKFRRKADTYRKENGVGSACDDDTSDDFMDDLARKFWRRLRPTMEAPLYGADMEGTLFNKDDDCHGWNLNSLDTCLNVLRADAIDGDKDGVVSLPGVTSSYIYFGMWASTFAA